MHFGDDKVHLTAYKTGMLDQTHFCWFNKCNHVSGNMPKLTLDVLAGNTNWQRPEAYVMSIKTPAFT